MRFFLVSCPVKGSQSASIDDVDYDVVINTYNKISNYLNDHKNEQPEIAKKLMSVFMKMGHVQDVPLHAPIRVWTDTYNSTREFASMVVAKSKGGFESPIQNILLAPKSNGGKIFLGSPNHSWETRFSNRRESWMQVAVRIELFFNAIRADHDNHAIEDFIIFASPETLNMFQIMWRRDAWEKAFDYSAISNYSITLLNKDGSSEVL